MHEVKKSNTIFDSRIFWFKYDFELSGKNVYQLFTLINSSMFGVFLADPCLAIVRTKKQSAELSKSKKSFYESQKKYEIPRSMADLLIIRVLCEVSLRYGSQGIKSAAQSLDWSEFSAGV